MKKICALFCVLAMSIAIVTCGGEKIVNNNQTSSFPQELSVTGNKIVDEAGNPVVLKGVSIESPVVLSHSLQDKTAGGIFYFDQYLEWNEKIFQTISEWGAKVVRLPVYPAAWKVHGQTDCLRILDEAIGWAAKYGMYVIIDYHSIGFPMTGIYEPNPTEGYGDLYVTTKPEILAFWKTVSAHYNNNKSVAFYEIFNETVYPSFLSTQYQQSINNWVAWKALAEEVIDTIRVNDPGSVIVVGGLYWSYDLSYLSLDSANAISRKNIVYSVHPYPGVRAVMDSTTSDWDVSFGALSDRYPLFASEVGFLVDNPNELPYYEGLFVGQGKYRDAIKPYLTGKGIGWTAWCFSPYTWPKLLQDKNYTPNEAGTFFRQWLLEK